MTKKNCTKVLFGIILTGLCIGVFLLLWVGIYNVPSSDDYGYAIWTHDAWVTTHSITEIFKQAVYTSKHFWNYWQGLYSSAFILAFMPDIFGENVYAITAFITIAFILIGNIVFIQTFAGKLVGAEKIETGILAILLNLVTLQWMPSAVQGIYWYNGAMNYTFFYALMLITIAVIIRYVMWDSKKKDIMALTGLSILGFVIEGGNHITAFLMLLIFLSAVILGFVTKKQKLKFLVIPFAISAGGFIFNVTSPGTKVRQDAFTDRPGFWGTIKLSIQQTLEDLNNWLNFSYVLVLLVLVPILLVMVIRFSGKIGFKFRYPLLIVIISVGCLCLMRCPPYYAMGRDGSGRIDNIVYFMFVLLSVLDEFYILGWLYVKGILNGETKHYFSYLGLASALLLLAVSFYSMRDNSSFL